MGKRVVIFTGGIGVGKSVCAGFSLNYLIKYNKKVVKLNSYKDLYLPFIREKHSEIVIHNNRKDIIALIKDVHKKYGDKKGSDLLLQFINNTNNDIYIIDGKRNPSGIMEIKNILKNNCLVIGVVADDDIRVKRILRRKRNIDMGKDTKEILANIDVENKIYSIDKSIKIADYIIYNSGISKSILKKTILKIMTYTLNNNVQNRKIIQALWLEMLSIYKDTLPKKIASVEVGDLSKMIVAISLNNTFENFKLFHVDDEIMGEGMLDYLLTAYKKNNLSLLNIMHFYKKYSCNIFPGRLYVQDYLDNDSHSLNNEYEAKFVVGDKFAEYDNMLMKTVHQFPKNILEDDLVIDTKKNELKKKGIIIRFRKRSYGKTFLFTIKFKKRRGFVKRDIEIENNILKKHKIFFTIINDFLTAVNLQKINFYQLAKKNNNDTLVKYFQNTNYNYVRMRIQKRRKTFKLDEDSFVCLDELPGRIGKFIEIETSSEFKLNSIIKLLGLKFEQRISLDYGKMVIAYNQKRGNKNERCVKFN